jgi:hypothetical protein
MHNFLELRSFVDWIFQKEKTHVYTWIGKLGGMEKDHCNPKVRSFVLDWFHTVDNLSSFKAKNNHHHHSWVKLRSPVSHDELDWSYICELDDKEVRSRRRISRSRSSKRSRCRRRRRRIRKLQKCIVLVTGDVRFLNDSGLFLRVSVKKSSGILKQTVILLQQQLSGTSGPELYGYLANATGAPTFGPI